MIHKAEVVHNTDDQVREYLRKALALTDELEPPEDLRAIVFQSAVNLFSSKQVVLQQGPDLPAMAIPRNHG